MSDNKALERAEIIAALRYCASVEDCKGCPLGRYDGITCAGFSGMLRDAASLLERDTESSNDPLTLTELRGMDGEPVWNDTVKHWSLVDAKNERTMGKDGCWRPLDDRYHRHKPDGGGE